VTIGFVTVDRVLLQVRGLAGFQRDV